MSENKLYRFMPLPPDFSPAFCIVDEACAYARCSRWTGFRRMREGRWRAFKDGRITKIEFASVVEDMERTKAESRVASTGKRPIGRPRKPPKEQPLTAAE